MQLLSHNNVLKKHCTSASHSRSTALYLMHKFFLFSTFQMSGSSISLLFILAVFTLLVLALFQTSHGSPEQKRFLYSGRTPSFLSIRHYFTWTTSTSTLSILAHEDAELGAVDGPSHPEPAPKLLLLAISTTPSPWRFKALSLWPPRLLSVAELFSSLDFQPLSKSPYAST